MKHRDMIFTAEAAALIRMQFKMAGADPDLSRKPDNRAVNLNVIDMDYQGYVPLDIAQQIQSGAIAQEQVPTQYVSEHVFSAEPSAE